MQALFKWSGSSSEKGTPVITQMCRVLNNDGHIYLRVSTEEQATEAHGLESQQLSCRRFCDQRGWTVREVFCDPGVSGFKDVERRQFKRMMSSLREDRDANLVFFDYSRFGRRTLPALKAFGQLDKLGIYSVAVANPNIDCRTAAGRTARRIELSNAEDFSDQHAEKTAERMKAAFDAGRWCRPAPLGYRTLGTKVKGRANLVTNEDEARLIVKLSIWWHSDMSELLTFCAR